MMKKKKYITPLVAFDSIEEETGILGTASVWADNQDADDGGWDSDSKRSSLNFGNELVGPIEEENNSFGYFVEFGY